MGRLNSVLVTRICKALWEYREGVGYVESSQTWCHLIQALKCRAISQAKNGKSEFQRKTT